MARDTSVGMAMVMVTGTASPTATLDGADGATGTVGSGMVTTRFRLLAQQHHIVVVIAHLLGPGPGLHLLDMVLLCLGVLPIEILTDSSARTLRLS